MSWVRVPPEAALLFFWKSDCLGCAVLLCLVCLFDLACFFLSFFHLSFKNMYDAHIVGVVPPYNDEETCGYVRSQREQQFCDLRRAVLVCLTTPLPHLPPHISEVSVGRAASTLTTLVLVPRPSSYQRLLQYSLCRDRYGHAFYHPHL